MNSADFLDGVRARHNLKSDNQAAKLLGIPQSRISAYRTGRIDFGEETALIVAAALDVEPGYIMAELAAHRAKRTEVRDAWKRLAELAKRSAAAVRVWARRLAAWLKSRLKRPGSPSDQRGRKCQRCGHAFTTVAKRRNGRVLCMDCWLRECRSGGIATRFRAFCPNQRTIGRSRARISRVLGPALVLIPLLFGTSAARGEFLWSPAFETLDAAARAALEEAVYMAGTHEQAVEYAGAIYALNGWFLFTAPVTSGEPHQVSAHITMPAAATLVATYHNHQDVAGNAHFSRADRAAAAATQVPAYIVCGDQMLKYTPPRRLARDARGRTERIAY